MIATFSAFVLFIIAYTALGHTADPRAPFDAVGRIHPEIAIAYTIVAYSKDIALLAIALGGLPILFTAVKRALPDGPRNVLKLFVMKPKHALLLLGAALLITICFLSYLLATEYIFGSPATPCPPPNQCLFEQPPLIVLLDLVAIIGVITVFVFVILAITASLSLAVLRSEFSKGLLRFALVPIAILALMMGAATLSATVWVIRLWVAAPQFAASDSGLGNGQTAWVVAIIAAMALATLVTASAFGRGLKALRMNSSLKTS